MNPGRELDFCGLPVCFPGVYGWQTVINQYIYKQGVIMNAKARKLARQGCYFLAEAAKDKKF